MKISRDYLVTFTSCFLVFLAGTFVNLDHKNRTLEALKEQKQVIEKEIEEQANSINKKLEELEDNLGRLHGISNIAVDICKCESSLEHDEVWGLADEYGVAQYKKKTFLWMSKISGMTHLKWKQRKDQIKLLMWALENGYESHWACYDKIDWACYKKSVGTDEHRRLGHSRISS